MKPPVLDALPLAIELIRCPSVTPDDAGALDTLGGVLKALGFSVEHLPFSEPGTPDVDNLYARIGDGSGAGPHFCFAGHTDVVPVGERARWTVDPFEATVDQGYLLGRGAADMKAAIACFTAAASAFLADHNGKVPRGGAISLLITGDEEGPAINGTVKMLETLTARGEVWHACVVGEPTNPRRLGEMAKIGRRGSINGVLTVTGVEGHVAYPHLADNPIPGLVRLLGALDALHLDDGTEHFQPSNLEITTIDVGNAATNVIPRVATARFNIRFNDRHTGASLDALLRRTLDGTGLAYDLETRVSGEAFLTEPGALSEIVTAAVQAETGTIPELSTSGGTSDARFIARHCPVIEFGMVGETMHKADEKVRVEDLERLTRIYHDMLRHFFRTAR
ncbi:succinyl-diaminopimelate desuccinylase [Zavarzinia compransoris]|uniref:succinyl-diaminopimelate desuccinylase n=1 Tax=Zavarzinia marina TaxID=2911065 RepID=UPI001F3557FA|nr:succinyl-diaminopimelate desuccinylase [Zavarzinia marina]MCF4165840.1 succinyl-diaminopimelate desuccinylase [Zavarzinia marina]